MEKVTYITKSAAETKRLGKILASQLKGGETLSLIGDLGGGKTTFTQGLAGELGIKNKIVSPTFVIFKKFPVKNNRDIKWLYHFDLYRINDIQEMLDLGIEDIFNDKKCVSVIEWSQKITKIIPCEKNIIIRFKYLGKSRRQISFESAAQ